MNSNESTKGGMSRRAAVAAGLAPLVVARHVLGGAGYQAPSDKLRIAAVGVGGVGEDYVAGCAERRDRRALRPGPRVLRAGVQALSQGQGLQGLPADVRQGAEELRRADRGHAGPLAFAPGAGGPGHEQAHLLRQADDAHHRRGAEGEGGGAGLQGHHQGEPSGFAHLPGPGHHGAAVERGHRADTRSALLDRHALPQRVGQTQGGPEAARGDELGPVVRPVSGAAVPQDLPLRQLAPLVGFRHRQPGRRRPATRCTCSTRNSRWARRTGWRPTLARPSRWKAGSRTPSAAASPTTSSGTFRRAANTRR